MNKRWIFRPKKFALSVLDLDKFRLVPFIISGIIIIITLFTTLKWVTI